MADSSGADSTGSVTQVFAQMRAGQGDAPRKLWQQFFPRLSRLAAKTLAGRPQRIADADDAVQSAFASFLQRAGAGQFGDALNRDDLWNVLAVMTVRKSLTQARRERAAKRGGGRVIDEAGLVGADGDVGRLAELAAQMPSQEFDLRCKELLEMLDDEMRSFAVLRLLGYRNREIADQFDCTERKVERKLSLIRLKCQQYASE